MGVLNIDLIGRIGDQLFTFEKESPKKTAITYMLVAQILFSIMYTIIGFLRTEYTTIQILYFRMLYSFIFNTSFCKGKDLDIYVPNGQALKLLILRGTLGASAMILMFASFEYMNLSDCVVVNNLSPIWTNVMAIFLLGEKFQKKALVCFGLGFSGVIFMSRPSFLFGDVSSQESKNENINQLLGSLLALLGSVSVAYMTIILKKLTTIFKCHNAVQQQYSYIITIFSTASLLLIYQQASFDILNVRFLALGLFLSFIGWIAQLLFSRSFGLEETSIIAPISYVNTFITFLVDIYIFNSHIEITSIIGSALIILGSLGVIL
ncbi:integral membrane protein DUF6 containing protein (macronuclear) [Tetrahymena thermophila SB210]|uniref:Integral membrane protein DUF6 containing protein n=1 Tax=Tetrahymena thermophila (strain SB210) TaxID=312017 RepID=Q22DT7_TETTS|nr:integral membrane protein DUF6 containing protein [Tetrahymena thermophila SB210]EAR83468.2 integral membrane protein DUF6 containing protein [Tetrahymena thermophila SB210]|eukprot:XP_001031131.2 integral membrane protein DUF6 containing protein [Tetrahymena thermophila SB210]